MNSIDLKALKAKAKEQMSFSGDIFFTYLIVILLVNVALELVASFTLGLGTIFVTGPLSVGLAVYMIQVAKGNKPKLEEVFNYFKDVFTKNFVNTMVSGLVVVILLSIGYFFFVIPGIYLTLRYAMVFYIQADHPEMDGMSALKASAEMMKGHMMELFIFQLSFIGWWCLVFFTFGLAGIWVGPYIAAATTNYYEALKGNAPEAKKVEAVEEKTE